MTTTDPTAAALLADVLAAPAEDVPRLLLAVAALTWAHACCGVVIRVCMT